MKGGGGALLQEKMVESTCKKFIVVADESKVSNGLGPHFDLPVEITQVFKILRNCCFWSQYVG